MWCRNLRIYKFLITLVKLQATVPPNRVLMKETPHITLGLYEDNGKEHGNSYKGLYKVLGLANFVLTPYITLISVDYPIFRY